MAATGKVSKMTYRVLKNCKLGGKEVKAGELVNLESANETRIRQLIVQRIVEPAERNKGGRPKGSASRNRPRRAAVAA